MQTSGGAELAALLNTLSLAVRRRKLHAALKLAAEPMRARMGQLAPREPGAPDLADSMVISVATRIGSVDGGKWEVRDDFQAAVAVGPSKGFFYGIMQEYGTVYHAAQPFGRPAFDAMAPVALGILGEQLWIALRAAAKAKGSTPMDFFSGYGSLPAEAAA